nr:FecR domain-containing protein [uncultured Pseudomonas sp.]
MSAEPPQAPPPHADDVSHQASRWFALIQGGAPTDAERARLAAWLDADPRHRAAYARLEQLWAATAQLHPPVPKAAAPLSRRRFVGLGIAASAVAVTASTSAWWFSGMGSPFADVRSGVGERRSVALPDGSTVELAGNTALNLDFSSGKRSVELLQGEAYFNVQPNTGSEFAVATLYGQVLTADGEFCLSCDSTSALLAVSRKTASVVTANQRTDLDEGLSLRFTRHHAGPIQHAELEQVLAWRSGRLVFFDKPLASVVEQLQRWRPGRIFVMDEQLAARRVSLILNLDKPEQLLDAMTTALSIRTQRYTDLVTLIYPA